MAPVGTVDKVVEAAIELFELDKEQAAFMRALRHAKGGLNVLVGGSGMGKTRCAMAIIWICWVCRTGEEDETKSFNDLAMPNVLYHTHANQAVNRFVKETAAVFKTIPTKYRGTNMIPFLRIRFHHEDTDKELLLRPAERQSTSAELLLWCSKRLLICIFEMAGSTLALVAGCCFDNCPSLFFRLILVCYVLINPRYLL